MLRDVRSLNDLARLTLSSGPGRSALRWSATVLALFGYGCDAPVQSPERKRSLPVIQPSAAEAPGTAGGISSANGGAPKVAQDQPYELRSADAHSWACARSAGDPFDAIRKAIAATPVGRASPKQLEDARAALEASVARHPGPVRRLVLAGPPLSRAEIESALEVFESAGAYDELVSGLAFRASRSLGTDDLTMVLARVERHASITVALRRALAHTGPAVFSAWRSKSAPPAGFSPCVVPEGFVARVELELRARDAGTFDRDAALVVDLAPDTKATLVRRGTRTPSTGQLTLRRLDLLRADEAEVVLQHGVLGSITLPKGQTLSTWNVRSFLSDTTRQQLASVVKRAAAGDAPARSELEHTLFTSWSFIEEELEARPGSPGAPALRMLLTLFNE